MATDNKGVMVYVTPELEEALEQYCMERNITRKTRDGHVFASLGTGIVQYLKSQFLDGESKSVTSPSTILTKDEVLNLIKEYSTNNTPSTIPDESLRVEVGALGELITKLETYTQNQIAAVREELKKPLAVAPIQSINRATDPSRRTWGQFFEMVGIAAMTAGEAQKKENTLLRDKQIAEGIALAQKIGLGVWTATRAGREFTKSDDAPNP